MKETDLWTRAVRANWSDFIWNSSIVPPWTTWEQIDSRISEGIDRLVNLRVLLRYLSIAAGGTNSTILTLVYAKNEIKLPLYLYRPVWISESPLCPSWRRYSRSTTVYNYLCVRGERTTFAQNTVISSFQQLGVPTKYYHINLSTYSRCHYLWNLDHLLTTYKNNTIDFLFDTREECFEPEDV